MSAVKQLEYSLKLRDKNPEEWTEEERTGLAYETWLLRLLREDLDEFRLLNEEFIQWKKARKPSTLSGSFDISSSGPSSGSSSSAASTDASCPSVDNPHKHLPDEANSPKSKKRKQVEPSSRVLRSSAKKNGHKRSK
ncbi:unnamed protein product [Sympodiomycopsis kandeliae]